MPTESITCGAHHVGLTVPDLDAARGFFVDLLGYREVGAKPEYPAVFVSDGHTLITLWRAADPSTARPFDRHHSIGLHHLALRVGGADLDSLHRRLMEAPGVNIEFSPETLGTGPTRHMMCTIPGGIRLEFIAPQN